MTTTKENGLPWSYSRISCFKDCKRKYHFRYVEKIRGTTSTAMERGNRIHAMCEQYVKGIGGEAALKQSLACEGIKTGGVLFDWLTALRKRVDGTDTEVVPELALHVSSNWCVTEKYSPEHWGTAILDVFQAVGDGANFVVTDWKTGKVYPEAHEFQALLYALTVYKVFGKIPLVRFVYVDANEDHEYPAKDGMFSVKDMEDAEFLLRSILADMAEEAEFAPEKGKSCFFCDYKDLCKEMG